MEITVRRKEVSPAINYLHNYGKFMQNYHAYCEMFRRLYRRRSIADGANIEHEGEIFSVRDMNGITCRIVI